METIDTIEGCVVKHETSGTNKPICVLGVLLTDKGIEIREEMLSMLRGKFDIYTVEQQAPGVLFEYPALLYVRKLTQDTGKPCLYLHTKGAANTNYAQPLVRKMWYDELIGNHEKYLEAVNTNIPTVACPYCSLDGVTWFNGFVANRLAMEHANVVKKDDRYYFEAMFSRKNCDGVTVKGIVMDNIQKYNIQDMFNDMSTKYGQPKLSALY